MSKPVNDMAMFDRANEVAEDLNGTCRDLSEFATEEEMNNFVFCQQLDAQVALCDGCGWWCDADDVDEDYKCPDCIGEGDD